MWLVGRQVEGRLVRVDGKDAVRWPFSMGRRPARPGENAAQRRLPPVQLHIPFEVVGDCATVSEVV